MSRRKKNAPFPLWWPLLAVIPIVAIISLIILFSGSVEPVAEPEPTVQTLAANEYAPEAFYREGEFLRYANDEYLLGVDVSAHQGVIDWESVAASGIDYAIVRVGYRGTTVGDLYEDEQFRYNLEEAQKHGLKVGAYFFSQALNSEEALQEAEYACRLLEGCSLELPVYFDWEYVDGRIESMDAVPITDCAVTFCEKIRSQGYQPGIYFNLELGYNHLNLMQVQDYHLWLAEYNEPPTFRYHFDSLQFTDNGRIDGIETPVDLDILFVD